MVKRAEPGKWIVGAGLLILGFILVFTGLSFGSTIHPLYFLLALTGVYLDFVVIDDQVIRNLRARVVENQESTE